MKYGITLLVCALSLLPFAAWAQSVPEGYTELARTGEEFTSAKVVAAEYKGQKGLGIFFYGSHDLHYYADKETAPLAGMELTVAAEANDLSFGTPQLPVSIPFRDPALDTIVNVFVGEFRVFLPFAHTPDNDVTHQVTVTIDALTCTSTTCLAPFTQTLTLDLTPASADWISIKTLSDQAVHTPNQASPAQPIQWSTLFRYLGLAILAGILINAMPCVLPVIPIIIMRLVEQSKQSGSQRILSGVSFCSGMIAFFVLFAAIAAILNVTTGSVINLNSLFRDPNMAIGLFLLIVLFAMIMFDFLPVLLPASVSGHQSKGTGASAALGTGFFAAILSIPCSGALLGSVMVWAQTQPVFVSSLCIILMGVGMALPYAVIIANPVLLHKLPKPGAWMEHFKKTCGFLLLFIAVKIALPALSKDRLINVLLYGIVLSFCIWVWGTWVTFTTPVKTKYITRLAMVLLVIGAGVWLLPSHTALIPWEPYDAQVIEDAQANGQPVLIKFTADWCTNCKVLERRVFESKSVADLIETKGILAIKADTTTRDMPATQDLNAVYQEAGNVPVTILLLPDQAPIKLRGIFKKHALKELIIPLPDKPIDHDPNNGLLELQSI